MSSNRDIFIRTKARELCNLILVESKKLRPSSRRIMASEEEVVAMNSRMKDYFKGYPLESLDEEYDIMKRCFLYSSKQVRNFGTDNDKKYFRISTLVRPSNFMRFLEEWTDKMDQEDKKKEKMSGGSEWNGGSNDFILG